ncbi:MAG: glycosyltransferase [Candidatus Krumholzibacteria bacterium]|jgi:glycosyltransferase involved in cell wall biosynthesis|nr:glycosyltransferase [Candidatus Krumholzibacteria bacterium]
MRVLYVTNLFPDRSRPGFAPFNRQQLVHLAKLHEIRSIVPLAWPHRLGLLAKGTRPGPPDDCAGMKFDFPTYYYTPKIFRDAYWRFYLWSIRQAFMRAAADLEPDIVYASWAYPDCRAVAELAGACRLPIVCRLHGSDINDYFRFPGRKHLALDAMRMAQGIVSINEDLAARLRYEGIEPAKIHVVYNGVDRDIFKPGDRDRSRSLLGLGREKKIILFAGNLKPVKGIDLLLAALSGMEPPGVELHLLGRGPEQGHLEQLAVSEGLSGRVFFHGGVKYPAMVHWYNAADVFCLPSLHEGTPNVILESLACRVPVVASRTGGIPEIVTPRSGILFECGDYRSLRAALEESLRREWDRSAIECPAETWAINAQRVTEVFADAIRSFAGRP